MIALSMKVKRRNNMAKRALDGGKKCLLQEMRMEPFVLDAEGKMLNCQRIISYLNPVK